MELANSADLEAGVDSHTSTDYGSFPSGIPTILTQTKNFCFLPRVQTTEEMIYGSFPDRVTTTEGAIDHEQSTVEDPGDDTMMEVGEDQNENNNYDGTVREVFSSPLSSFKSTPKARRVPNDRFNRSTVGGSFIALRYHQEVGWVETLNILP
jgi:hypothetical protein